MINSITRAEDSSYSCKDVMRRIVIVKEIQGNQEDAECWTVSPHQPTKVVTEVVTDRGVTIAGVLQETKRMLGYAKIDSMNKLDYINKC